MVESAGGAEALQSSTRAAKAAQCEHLARAYACARKRLIIDQAGRLQSKTCAGGVLQVMRLLLLADAMASLAAD